MTHLRALYAVFFTQVVASEAWTNHSLRNNSIIVDYFHGQFKSTVECPECKKVRFNVDSLAAMYSCCFSAVLVTPCIIGGIENAWFMQKLFLI